MNDNLLAGWRTLCDEIAEKDENTFTQSDYATIKQLLNLFEEYGTASDDTYKTALHGYLQRHPDGSQDFSPEAPVYVERNVPVAPEG